MKFQPQKLCTHICRHTGTHANALAQAHSHIYAYKYRVCSSLCRFADFYKVRVFWTRTSGKYTLSQKRPRVKAQNRQLLASSKGECCLEELEQENFGQLETLGLGSRTGMSRRSRTGRLARRVRKQEETSASPPTRAERQSSRFARRISLCDDSQTHTTAREHRMHCRQGGGRH